MHFRNSYEGKSCRIMLFASGVVQPNAEHFVSSGWRNRSFGASLLWVVPVWGLSKPISLCILLKDWSKTHKLWTCFPFVQGGIAVYRISCAPLMEFFYKLNSEVVALVTLMFNLTAYCLLTSLRPSFLHSPFIQLNAQAWSTSIFW